MYGKYESGSACRCCIFVSCVRPVVVFNSVLCIPFSLLIVVEDARGDQYGSGILQSWSYNCLTCCHECLLLFPNPVAVNAFIMCSDMY